MREITAVGDLTGDGYPDLVAVHRSSGVRTSIPVSATVSVPGPGWVRAGTR